ncbi:hypothetical protein Hanom_Chr09g00809211 [Helianthus anomalus]
MVMQMSTFFSHYLYFLFNYVHMRYSILIILNTLYRVRFIRKVQKSEKPLILHFLPNFLELFHIM